MAKGDQGARPGRTLAQILLLTLLWAGAEGAARLTGLPVPGSILGLGILLALLASGRLPVDAVRGGASWLLAEMLLFFVPAVLAVLDHPELWGRAGLLVLAVIALGTSAIMAATALAVEVTLRLAGARRGHAAPPR